MEKYLQDRAWSMLPCKYREEVKRLYDEFKDVSDRYKDVPCLSDADRRSSDRNIGHLAAMRAVFGHHNLTSDAEGEEMLCVKASKVREMYALNENILYFDSTHKGAILLKKKLTELFGFKCLPDELNEDNFATKKPQPAEPKNEGTHQEQCVPKNAESGTHSFSHILKGGFHDNNRLHIAAMVMQGVVANGCISSPDEIAKYSFAVADALIAAVKEGGSHD